MNNKVIWLPVRLLNSNILEASQLFANIAGSWSPELFI